jgi:protein phosphatase
VDIATQTDPGRERDLNEDAVLAEPLPSVDGYLIALADGMGGHNAGEVASELAVEQFEDTVLSALSGDQNNFKTTLADAAEEANRRVRSAAESDPELSEMGTTLVGAVVTGGPSVVVNVGDSRAYRIDSDIEQITTDHSLAQQLVEAGQIDPEEADDHPKQHVLSQAIGSDTEISPDIFEVELQEETLLLCSDGLTNELSDARIADIVAEHDSLETTGSALVDAANANGGRDNISVALLRQNI